MPELPDVEIFKRLVEQHCIGRVVARVDVTDPGSLEGATVAGLQRRLKGRGLASCRRHGKVLFVGLDSTWRWRYKAGDTYHHRFWGQLVTDWAHVPMPKLAPAPHNPALMLDWRRVCSDTIVAFVRMQADLLRELTPHAPVTSENSFPVFRKSGNVSPVMPVTCPAARVTADSAKNGMQQAGRKFPVGDVQQGTRHGQHGHRSASPPALQEALRIPRKKSDRPHRS